MYELRFGGKAALIAARLCTGSRCFKLGHQSENSANPEVNLLGKCRRVHLTELLPNRYQIYLRELESCLPRISILSSQNITHNLYYVK